MTIEYVRPSKVYRSPGRCAYCSAKDGLTDEHIIAFGLGGRLVLSDASCPACSQATCKVEDFVLRQYLGPLRSYLSLPSRNPRQRPDGYKLKLWGRDGRIWNQKVSISEHPGVVRFMVFSDPPGRVAGRGVNHPTFSVRFEEAKIFPDWQKRMVALGAYQAQDKVAIKALDIARMVAKTAHAFAIAELGHGAFEETYADHLIWGDTADWNYWVGGHHRAQVSNPRALHEVGFLRRGNELSVIVHLFAPFCSHDAYEVIVGRLRPEVVILEDLVLE